MLLRCLFYVTMNMYFYFVSFMSTLHVTFVTVVFVFAKYLSRHLHIFTRTYRDKYTLAHMYNQHTRGITTAGHRDLDEGRKDFVRDLTHTYTHTEKKEKNTQKKNKNQKKIDGKKPFFRI